MSKYFTWKVIQINRSEGQRGKQDGREGQYKEVWVSSGDGVGTCNEP